MSDLLMRIDLDDPRAAYFDPEDIVAPDLNARPWPKCCDVCAFLPHDPQHLGAQLRASLISDVKDDEVEFYCVHRLSRRGLHRICAGAAAIRARAVIEQKDATP